MDNNEEDENKDPNSWFFSRLKGLKPNEIILGLTLLCYISGIAVSSLYLGSLGILNFDIIRVKYILTGFLFIIFAGIIFYPLIGLVSLLRKNQGKSVGHLLGRTILFSIERFSLTAIIIISLGAISNFATLPVGIANLTPAPPWRNWIDTEPINALISTVDFLVRLFLGIGIIFGVIFLIVIIINPSTGDNEKITRWMWVKEIIRWTIKKLFSWGMLIFIIVAILIGQAVSLLNFISNSPSSAGSLIISEGWSRFLITSFLVYILFASILLVLFTTPKLEKTRIDPTHAHPDYTTSSLVTILFLAGVILPVYAIGVYPSIPQQIGGGQVVSVEVFTSNDELNNEFSNATTKIYLIDRTSDGILIFLYDETSQQFRTLEIPQSEISVIEYIKQLP